MKKNGVCFLPVSEMLAVSGYESKINAANQPVTAKIEDTAIVLDLKKTQSPSTE